MTEFGTRYARLTRPLLARSISDNYEEAKKEWRMTGNVWRGAPDNHPCNHVDTLGYVSVERISFGILKLRTRTLKNCKSSVVPASRIGWFCVI